MLNMGYCRFRNTVEVLLECYEDMDEMELSKEEQQARERLIRLCMDIAKNYKYEVENN